jgi:hypothetical protein
VSASAGAGTGTNRVVEFRRWLGSICAATCRRNQTTVIKGESSPALECPLTKAPDGIVSREGGRLAGQTNDRWCHDSVVRAQHERLLRATSLGHRRCRKVPAGTGRNNPKPGWHFRSGASGAGTHRIEVRPTGHPRGRTSPACGRQPETRRFDQTAGQRQEGQVGREVRSAAWEGKPLKGKPHRRHRRETKPEGCRAEQSARRLRKPVGAAQPGQANPVLVAARYLMRQRGQEPHEGSRFARRSTVGQTLERSESPREDETVFQAPDPGATANTSKIGSQDQGHGGWFQPMGTYRLFGNTLKDKSTAREEEFTQRWV